MPYADIHTWEAGKFAEGAKFPETGLHRFTAPDQAAGATTVALTSNAPFVAKPNTTYVLILGIATPRDELSEFGSERCRTEKQGCGQRQEPLRRARLGSLGKFSDRRLRQ